MRLTPHQQLRLHRTPYRKVDSANIANEISYTSALEEAGHYIAPVGRDFVVKSKLAVDTLVCRINGEYESIDKEKVTLMDVSPSQVVSIAASLIPFLEHDDANRALMGSNMQRQAVPLLRSRAPLVGTGVERLVARDSGTSVVTQNDGVVEEVDASRVVIRRFAKAGSSARTSISTTSRSISAQTKTRASTKSRS